MLHGFSPKLAFRECKFRRKTIQPERFSRTCILDRQVKAEPPYAAAPSPIAARGTWRGARSVSFYGFDSFWVGTPQRAQPTDFLSSKRQGTKRMDGSSKARRPCARSTVPRESGGNGKSRSGRLTLAVRAHTPWSFKR